MLGGGGVFQNAGLTIGILDQIPESVKTGWAETHAEKRKLDADFAATGIADLLKSKGRRWYAMSPARQEDGTHKVWLNPEDQENNNYGWFTIEDLRQWADGKGPCIGGRKAQRVGK